ncbi:hypothetical protein YC2023_104385 [Brassica napus]
MQEVIADPEVETSEDILTKHFKRQDLDKVLDSLREIGEPGKSEADRVLCFQETQEREEKQPFAAILSCIIKVLPQEF